MRSTKLVFDDASYLRLWVMKTLKRHVFERISWDMLIDVPPTGVLRLQSPHHSVIQYVVIFRWLNSSSIQLVGHL
jgi:hypothetical protein